MRVIAPKEKLVITKKRHWLQIAHELPSIPIVVKGLNLDTFRIAPKQEIAFEDCTFNAGVVMSPRSNVRFARCRWLGLDVKAAFNVTIVECKFFNVRCGTPDGKRLPGDTVTNVSVADSDGDLRIDADSIHVRGSDIRLFHLANAKELRLEKSRVLMLSGDLPDINIWSSDSLIMKSCLPVMTAEIDSRGYLVNLMRYRELSTENWKLWVTAGCRSMSYPDACSHWTHRDNQEMLDIVQRGAHRFVRRYGHMFNAHDFVGADVPPDLGSTSES